ncbi:DUF5316 domain-containing protein [Virgibacillus sp. C22-A2]|uniref:DUF5316 domain-containing protein n=1 Tax=Virgibacillus tibetensis TaxID=3042313 RepID=A0ABU6KFW7_9BACI|nr:DUF5316 domain-containing protein [Virgibacillus sp. C22-A2]
MKKTFLIAFIVSLVLFLLGIVTGNIEFYGSITLGIGVVFLLIGALFSGAFISGEQLRANYHTETKEDRSRKNKTMSISIIIALPHLVAGGLLFTYFN